MHLPFLQYRRKTASSTPRSLGHKMMTGRQGVTPFKVQYVASNKFTYTVVHVLTTLGETTQASSG